MSEIAGIERVTDNTLQEVVQRIVTVGPHKIILFDSYTHGYPHPNGDLDLLLV